MLSTTPHGTMLLAISKNVSIMLMWLILAVSVVVVFLVFRTGRQIYYGRRSGSKYSRFTAKKKG